MALQIVNIKDSKVKFVNEANDPMKSVVEENANFMFQNAMQDLQINSLQAENAELLFRIANIEMGGIL